MKRVIVHIDRLLLQGFRHEDRHAVAAGLEQQLAREFAIGGAAAPASATRDASQIKVGPVPLAHGSTPRRIGERVAHSIAGKIGK